MSDPNFTAQFNNASSAYINANKSLSKKPTFYVKFGLVTGPLGTNSQVLPNEYCSGPILNATKTRKRLLNTPTKTATQINVITSETSIASSSFSLINIDGEISDLVSKYIMKNRLVTIYQGFNGIAESDYAVFFQGQINNWSKSADATTYTFSVVDAKKQLKATILSGHTQLTQNYDPNINFDGIFYVTATDNFATKSDYFDGLGGRNYLRVKDTLYSYSAVTTNTIQTTGVVQLNANGATNEAHQAGENVDNYVLFQGNPVNIMLQIMLSTGTGTNYSGTGTNYDVLPASQGVGVPYNLVNISSFESQRDLYITNFYFSQFYQAEAEALKFIQSEILRQINAFIFVNQQGLLDIKFYYDPIGRIDAILLDNSNIIGTPQFDANLQTGNDFYNEVDITWDYQPIPDYFVNELLVEGQASQAKYEEVSSLSIQNKFVKTLYGARQINDRIASIILSRFADPPPIITLDTLYTNHLFEPGDPVYVDSSTIPNYVTGKDGGSPILCEIISVQINSNMSVTLTILGTGFNNTKRLAAIGPDSLGQFSNETDANKRAYGFISSDSNLMPDNSAAYLITA